MEIIHNRLLNNQFAPGIATYGIDGKDGSLGPAGTSIYFTSYSLSDFDQYNEALVKINQNKVLSGFVDQDNYREYGIGDLVLDPVGKIYRIVQKNGTLSLNYVSEVIGLTDSNYFKITRNNRVAIDSSYNGLDIVTGELESTFESNDTKFALRVVNSKEDTKTGNFNILSLMSRPTLGEEKSLNISYNKNSNAFVFDTDSNIVLSSDRVSVMTNPVDTPSFGEYYRIAPYNDPIGLVHKMYSNAKWEVDGASLTISDIDEIPAKSIGIHSSHTCYVKVVYDDMTEKLEEVTETNGTITIEVSEEKNVNIVSVIKGIEVFIDKK